MHTSRLLRAYAAFIITHRRWILASLALATLLMALGVTRLYVEVDPDRELPQGHPYVQAFHTAHYLFGDKNLIIISLTPTRSDTFSPAFLTKVKAITDQIAAMPGIVAPMLQSIAAQNAKTVSLEASGLSVRPLISQTPIGEAEADALKTRVLADPTFMGTLVSHDASTLAIYATFELTPELPGYVNLVRALTALLDRANDGSFSFRLAGPVAIVASLSTYATEVLYYFPLALIVIALIHYHAFRTWQAVALPLATGLLAVIWALGLMGHLGVPLDPFNSTTPVLILAIGAGHAVQI